MAQLVITPELRSLAAETIKAAVAHRAAIGRLEVAVVAQVGQGSLDDLSSTVEDFSEPFYRPEQVNDQTVDAFLAVLVDGAATLGA